MVDWKKFWKYMVTDPKKVKTQLPKKEVKTRGLFSKKSNWEK